jgi:hypothetical protein
MTVTMMSDIHTLSRRYMGPPDAYAGSGARLQAETASLAYSRSFLLSCGATGAQLLGRGR